MAWFAAVAIAVSYGSYFFAGSIVTARAAGLYEPVLIRDALTRNAHHLSGMIMVQSPCDQLSVRIETLSDTMYMLNFSTWREPSVVCKDETIPRAFNTIVFAPSVGVEFGATLDGVTLPIVVIPHVSRFRVAQ